jgi:hypothetical protein
VVGGRVSRDQVDAYVAAVYWLCGIVGRVEGAFWVTPSAVARCSVGAVAAHAVHGVAPSFTRSERALPDALRVP